MTSEPQPAATQAKERCAVCGAEIPELGVYCPNCGAVKPSMVGKTPPYAPSWMRTGPPIYRGASVPQVRSVFKMIAGLIMLTLIAWVLFAFVSLIAGMGIVIPDIQTNALHGFSLYLAIPYLVFFGSLSGSGLIAYYIFLVVAITASLAWVLVTSVRGYSKELLMKAMPREHSPLFEVSALMLAVLFLNVVIVIITGAANTPTPGNNETDAQLLFSLANAPVWEEIIVRILFIGVPLIFVDLVRRKFRKDWYAYFLGGKFTIGIPELVLLVASSAMFGVAHYLGGWGEWKIPAAGIAGLAFGYLFLRFGIAAAIVLHFMFDYLSAPEIVFSSVDFTSVLGVLTLLWVAAGAVFTGYYIVRIIEHFTGVRFWEERPQQLPWGAYYVQRPRPTYQSPTQHGPPYGAGQLSPNQPSYPPQPQTPGAFGGYVCPNCGNLEARWVEGRFQCLRCGHLS